MSPIGWGLVRSWRSSSRKKRRLKACWEIPRDLASSCCARCFTKTWGRSRGSARSGGRPIFFHRGRKVRPHALHCRRLEPNRRYFAPQQGDFRMYQSCTCEMHGLPDGVSLEKTPFPGGNYQPTLVVRPSREQFARPASGRLRRAACGPKRPQAPSGARSSGRTCPSERLPRAAWCASPAGPRPWTPRA